MSPKSKTSASAEKENQPTADEAPEAADEQSEEPVLAAPDAFEAQVVTPPEDDEAPQEPAPLEVPEGEVAIVYRGAADAFRHGEVTFRPGQPVSVPSDVAEELLTYPNEQFELLDEPKE